LQFRKPVGNPVPIPGIDLLLRLTKALQMLQNPQVVEWMDLGRDELRERAHPRAGQRVARHQPGLRVRLVEILDDGERLTEARAVVELERRQQRLRIDLGIGAAAVLAFREVDEHGLVLQALQVQRDANAERRRAAEVRVELQSAGTIFPFSSPTPSMPACSSSPGFTGPTPAGVPL